MGNVVFVYHDQIANKMISFTCINDRYAYLYFFFDVIIILVIVYTFAWSWSIYFITALSSSFFILVLVERPYSKDLVEFENIVALYLALMLLLCEVVLCVISSANLPEGMELVMTIIIVALVLVGEILTITRIALRVNMKKAFDDLKNPKGDRDNENQKKKRVKEKNLDLLEKDDSEIKPPDSVRDGLFTPKDRMIDWEARNSEEYESMRIREGLKDNINVQPQSDTNEHDEANEEAETKFN